MPGRWKKLAFAAVLAWAASAGGSGPGLAQTKPEGEMKFALYVTIAPAWFDPGETQAKAMSAMLDELLKWTQAMKPMRDNGTTSAP